MLPKVIVHNSVSVDGSFLDFEIDMGLHYDIAKKLSPEVHLIGSNTARVAIEKYHGKVPVEEERDFNKSKRKADLPYWVMVDTGGKLEGLLHVFRRFEHCRDVIVLVSERTPDSYLMYLKERRYDHYIVGKDKISCKEALELLSEKYQVEIVMTDTGRTLCNVLLNEGLVDEISLVMQPEIVGEKSENLFKTVAKPIKLKLMEVDVMDNIVWLHYKLLENSII